MAFRISATAAAAAAVMMASGAQAVTPAAAVGTWSGSYICAQGRTDVIMTLRARNNGAVSGVMSFNSRNDGAKGAYALEGSVRQSGRITLVGSQWRDRPGNYVMVDFDGTIYGNTMSGSVRGPACSTFKVTRQR